MNTNTQIKKVFTLYSRGDFKEAQKLNNQILEQDPNNIYAKRYAGILADKNEGREKIAKIKGKSLKCPHCVAKIPFSALNIEQQKDIKSRKYNNLEIKCPYCHTQFVLQKRKADSMLWLKIWDIATIDGKKYRTTGYVQYKWMWYEGSYSGKTAYLEWILLWEDNSYYYFSEGSSLDEGEIEYEFELSQKIVPDFQIPSSSSVFSSVKVISVYWENSKSYTVWEKTEVFEFSRWWKKYVLEKEWVWSQREAWIYESTALSRGKAFALFWKKIPTIDELFKQRVLWIQGTKKIAAIVLLGLCIGFYFYLIIPPYLHGKVWVKVGWEYYLDGQHTKYNGTTTCSDDGDTRTCYSYTKTKWLAFSIKNQEDVDLFNRLRSQKNPDEKLQKIVEGRLYSFMWDYSRFNELKGVWLFLIGFLIFGIIIIFSKKK